MARFGCFGNLVPETNPGIGNKFPDTPVAALDGLVSLHNSWPATQYFFVSQAKGIHEIRQSRQLLDLLQAVSIASKCEFAARLFGKVEIAQWRFDRGVNLPIAILAPGQEPQSDLNANAAFGGKRESVCKLIV